RPDGTKREALNPLRHQMLAKAATVSFFESVFNSSPAEREKAKESLANSLAKENDDVHVRGKYTASCPPPHCQSLMNNNIYCIRKSGASSQLKNHRLSRRYDSEEATNV